MIIKHTLLCDHSAKLVALVKHCFHDMPPFVYFNLITAYGKTSNWFDTSGNRLYRVYLYTHCVEIVECATRSTPRAQTSPRLFWGMWKSVDRRGTLYPANVSECSLFHARPIPKMSRKPIDAFVCNVVNSKTERQSGRLTDIPAEMTT